MTDRQKHLLSLGVLLVFLAAAIYMVATVKPRLGLDLRGGLSVRYVAKDTAAIKVTEDRMRQAEFVLRQRVDALGVAEPEVQREGPRNIIVQLPGVKNPEEVRDILAKPAVLEFAVVQDEFVGLNEKQLNDAQKEGKKVLGPVLLTGDTVTDARATFGGQVAQQPEVSLTFNNEGTSKFAQITAQNVNKRLAIVLDDQIITAPNINEPIPEGKAVINGVGSIDEAKKIALVLNTGSIPVELDVLDMQQVGPTLGAEALRQGLIALAAGFALVALYMLLYYQGLGIVSWVGLAVFGALMWGIVSAIGGVYGWTLTLPGIAGLIISIGMAADSSIIIFERIKEEMLEKKTFRTAVDSGFWHGFRTSLDANLVTVFAALALFTIGIGPVKGFALALLIGLTIDTLIMLMFTRPILGLLATIWPVKSPSLLVWLGRGVTENA